MNDLFSSIPWWGHILLALAPFIGWYQGTKSAERTSVINGRPYRWRSHTAENYGGMVMLFGILYWLVAIVYMLGGFG